MVLLRLATINDAQLVFEWRNDPWIVNLGLSKKEVLWEEHYEWFKNSLKNQRRKIFIIEYENILIGQVRFEKKSVDQAEISIYLIKKYTGYGLGVVAIKKGCQEIFSLWEINKIVAEIRSNNHSSLSAFKKAGFYSSFSQQDYFCDEDKTVKLFLSRFQPIPHNRLTFGEEEVRAVSKVIFSGYWSGGPQLAQLEKELIQRTQVSHAVGVASGLGALRLGLKSLGIGTEDEVIIPAYSCVALANAVLSLGAIPVPVDVRELDWNIDPQCAHKVLSSKTKALIAVNTFGSPAPIEELRQLQIPIIEDCSHGLGLEIKGKQLGNRSDVAIVSFYATKLIGGGEGGAVLTNQSHLAEFIRCWRDYTDQSPNPMRLNDKMNDLEAALALCQLQRLNSMVSAREVVANRYNQRLKVIEKTTGKLRLPIFTCHRIWYRYVVKVISAKMVIKKLKQMDIYAEYPITDWRRTNNPSCPVADCAFQELVSLPIYPTLRLDEQERVCRALITIMQDMYYE